MRYLLLLPLLLLASCETPATWSTDLFGLPVYAKASFPPPRAAVGSSLINHELYVQAGLAKVTTQTQDIWEARSQPAAQLEGAAVGAEPPPRMVEFHRRVMRSRGLEPHY